MEWMDGDPINDYMNLINKHRSGSEIYASDSYMIQRLSGRSLAGGGDRVESFWQSLRKQKLETLRKWIIPLNEDNVHWKLAVVMIKEHLIVFYDSISDGPPSLHMDFASSIRYLLRTYGQKYDIKSFRDWPWISCTPNAFSELQKDVYSCGVFCIAAADLNSLHPTELVCDISINDLNNYRTHIHSCSKFNVLISSTDLASCTTVAMPQASAVRAADPHFTGDIKHQRKSISKLLMKLRQSKLDSHTCEYPRYAIAWNMTESNILRLFKMVESCSRKISFTGTRVCIHLPDFNFTPLIFERLLLGSLLRSDSNISLHIICNYDQQDLGVVPLEDYEPSSAIFTSENYLQLACLSESIHALRQTLTLSLDNITIGRFLPEDGCELLITRSTNFEDEIDLCLRKTSLRETLGCCIYVHDMQSIQLAYQPDYQQFKSETETNGLYKRVYPCYSGEFIERLLF